jgi:microcystin-dependent protein
MTEPFLSEIALFAFGFAPQGWALCNGQLLPINQNQALFSLLGTTYGGDGQTTFALPDLRGRVPIHVGGGHVLGERAGAETVTLATTQIPAHTHALDLSALTATGRGTTAAASLRSPVSAVPAVEATHGTSIYSSAAPDANMSSGAVLLGGGMTAASTGGGQAHTNLQPSLTLNYCIALQGFFPGPNL